MAITATKMMIAMMPSPIQTRGMTVCLLWARASSPEGGKSSSSHPCRPGPRDSSSLRGGANGLILPGCAIRSMTEKRACPGHTYARPAGRLKPIRPASRVSRLRVPEASALAVQAPPPKPVSEPSAPITLWQGLTMAIGLAPFARPTARMALGRPMAMAWAP